MLKIGGFIKQSLIDYPGKISSVVFLRGCNFRCSFCHNSELVLPELWNENVLINQNLIIEYCHQNRNLLDAIVITGGEPLIQDELTDFIKILKETGLQIKLDTNGTNPLVLEQLITAKLIDYVAMDIKTRLELNYYRMVAGDHLMETDINKIKRSIRIIIDSQIDHEFRTTVVGKYFDFETLKNMIKAIKGFKRYFLQPIVKNNLIDKTLYNSSEYSLFDLEQMLAQLPDNERIRVRD